MKKADYKRLLDCIDIPHIDENTNFWMIRTQHGFFYDEYIKNGFVALGWNIITKDRIKKSKSPEAQERLYKEIKDKYKDIQQPGRPYNKCLRFINEIKENDIIMIPSAGREWITFALAGEYYEEDTLDYKREIEILTQIEEGWDETFEIECPYRKRRKINILRTISGNRLNPNLYKALVSYHGISNIDEYADYILSSVYNTYYWNKQMNYVFNVEKQKEINPVDISRFIISFAGLAGDILDDNTDIDKLDGKMNINSPGDILLTLKDYASNAVIFLDSNKLLILAIWFAITGGKIKILGNEYSPNSLLEYILKFREQNNKFKNDELRREFWKKHTSSITTRSEKIKINSDKFGSAIDLSQFINGDD